MEVNRIRGAFDRLSRAFLPIRMPTRAPSPLRVNVRAVIDKLLELMVINGSLINS